MKRHQVAVDVRWLDVVTVASPQVRAIPRKDCGEALVAPAVRSAVVLDRSTDVRVRESVSARLTYAASLVTRAGFELRVVEGFRGSTFQAELFSDYLDQLRAARPGIREAELRREASLFAAPPDGCAPHAGGGAVDVVLTDMSGALVDMGCAFDATPLESGNRCFTRWPGLAVDVAARRGVLVLAMSEAGFVNYPAEWWHWSYGDQYWAFTSGHPHALYGSLA